MTSQRELAARALARLHDLPQVPSDADSLGQEAAKAIVDETIEKVVATGDEVERTYLLGHRKRLIETLALTPKATHEGANFLDVGCYGYFGHWAIRHLGYGAAAGIEMPLPSGETRIAREVSIGDDTLTIDVHHFNLTDGNWPIDSDFDTAICLETLEHIDHDPSGVLSRLRDRLVPDGRLVLSVPNGVSYKTLSEFLSGMPPWTYWFYNPDLAHEPRHSLEYTPFLMALILDAAGFEQLSFRTIAAYVDEDAVADLYDLGARLGRPRAWFGETMIAVAAKRDDTDVLREPDALYSGERYYESTWPLIDPIRQNAIETLLSETAQAEQNAGRIVELERDVVEKTATLNSVHEDLGRSEARVAELERDVAEKTATLASLQEDLGRSEARMAELERDVAEKTATLASFQEDLGRSDARVAELEREMSESTDAIGQMALLLDIYERRLREIGALSGDRSLGDDRPSLQDSRIEGLGLSEAGVAEKTATLASLHKDLERSEARVAELEREMFESTDVIGQMALLLDIYGRRLRGIGALSGDRSLGDDRPSLQESRILALYRLMAPSGLKKFAEGARLPKEMSWSRHLRRHPLKVSEWLAIKRVARRCKQERNHRLLGDLFGASSWRWTDGKAETSQNREKAPDDLLANDFRLHSPPEMQSKDPAGPPQPASLTTLPPPAAPHPMQVPTYVATHAAPYQIDLYREFHQRVDVAGARVLEVGSDYHLATSRLFVANGASHVVAINIGDWKSSEPVPDNLDFVVGDVADASPSLGKFDIIYGIAVLEHIPDVPRVAEALRPLLAPGGIVFLQGEPIWGGSVGHHVWFDPVQGADPNRFAAGGSRTAAPMAYAFNDPAANPIPDWAHLVLTPEEMSSLLVQDGLRKDHAAGIVDYIFNLSRDHLGSCSNFQVASNIIAGFSRTFEVHADRQQYDVTPNEFYTRARESYSDEDLQTLGLRLWMR